MAANSKIQWTDHTFNPWRGCQKVAAGCTNCYADAQAKRNPGVLGIWGPNGSRVIASEDMWKQPLKWNRKEKEAGERHRVFCASLADVFEDWDGQCKMSDGSWANNCYTNGVLDRFAGVSLAKGTSATTLDHVRARLFKLIDATPNLDWLLLTKRPENIRRMWPFDPSKPTAIFPGMPGPLGKPQPCFVQRHRNNVWLGTSIAEQADADRNIPLLLKCRDLAPVLFLSIEPLIGPVELSAPSLWHGDCLRGPCSHTTGRGNAPMIDWVIVGGESGPQARPCHVDWIRSIVRQCKEAGCPVFVKQLGSQPIESDGTGFIRHAMVKDPKGGDPAEWPEDLRVREFPAVGVPT